MREMQHAFGGDPYGVRTIAGARAAYVRGDIEVDEFERRVELFLSGKPIAVLSPGERVLVPTESYGVLQAIRP
jgi:hypothetical protein